MKNLVFTFRNEGDGEKSILTEKYCKSEVRAVLGFQLLVATNFVYAALNTFVSPSSNGLPMNFYLWFLPFDGYSWQWAVNYIFQLSTAIASAYYLVYTPMTLILMRHSCLLAEVSLLQVMELKTVMKIDRNVRESFKNTIDSVEYVLKWQSSARDLLRISFFTELTILSVSFCLCIHTLTASMTDALYAFGPLSANLVQLYVCCWIGTEFKSLFEKLCFELYSSNWNDLEANVQRDLQMVLVMGQNVKGFNAVYTEINLNLLQKASMLENKLLMSRVKRFFFCSS